jgi:eukaryotic-like serine/threonine-protein kinase
MDSTLSRPSAGQLLDGRYRVDSWLARGGMASVYLGTDTRLQRTVALKIAHPELAGDPEFVRRFIGEARSVARLSSPNVVAVYDQGCDGQVLYLAMEYVPGKTLRDLLRERGRLVPGEALDVIEGVLSGLAAAHRAGIVHRDIKPENVLLGAGRTIKVADFGLARALAGPDYTKTGMIIGTAAYLAPEQVSRSTSDARTDVYAAGIVLYELLTGAQPHTGETPLAVAYKHVNEPVGAPSAIVPGLPPAMDDLVALATSRDPELRPADAGQFLQAVSNVRHGVPITPGGMRDQHATELLSGPLSPSQPGPAPGRYGPAPGHRYGRAPDYPYGSPPERYGRAPDERHGPTADRYGSAPAEAAHHTLVVPAGLAGLDGQGPGGYPAARQGYGRRGEPRLQRLLFSRGLAYLAAVLAVVLAAGLVTWWIADGRYATVPQLNGMAASTATAELHNLGFTVAFAPGKHSNLAKGEVISTDPATGARAPRGSMVRITESLGPVMIQVPSVTGMTLASAQAALRAAHLTPGPVRSVASSAIPVGIVISTTPVAGTSWPQPKPVAITVSAGPPLPEFVGQQLTAAQQVAQSGGYQLNPVPDASSNQPAGTITSQSPAPGTPVTPHEVVTVHVSPGPPMVAVPNVQGMSVNQATKILQTAGFKVTVNRIGPGSTVLSESPTGQAPRGSTITLTVSFITL